jgi:hypothetical protein
MQFNGGLSLGRIKMIGKPEKVLKNIKVKKRCYSYFGKKTISLK